MLASLLIASEPIMASKTLNINRAPVLTLWATVVAKRLGFKQGEALTLGRAIAGLNAQSKGRRLCIFKPHEAREKREEAFGIELLGRVVPAQVTEEGVRAVERVKPVDPQSVERYLEDKFGDDLKAARSAMEKLAKAYPPRELAIKAFSLYERFRPRIPAGVKGWGAAGTLDLGLIQRLAKP
jgi:hypothetical protein